MKAPKAGKRYHLLLYRRTLDRLWPPTLLLGLMLGAIWLWEWFYPTPLIQAGNSLWLAVAAIFLLGFSLFAFLGRNMAYVQPRQDHLRLVTPFLRMNISYQRFIQASSAEMGRMFPLKNPKGRKRDFLRPLAVETAIVLELRGWPLPRWVLNLFLSPYFFPDNTARLALLVPDWIGFSTELESFRGTWFDSLHHPGGTSRSDLLASLSDKG